MIGPESAELIRRFDLQPASKQRHRGWIPGGDGCPDLRDASTFMIRPAWSDGVHREIHASQDELAVFTFCEGDLTLEIFPTRDAFDAEILSCNLFYQ